MHQLTARRSLKFASTEPQEGDDIVSVGYPKGRPQTSTSGTITGLNRSIDIDSQRLEGLLQYNADTSPGNSGGPILNDQGQAVGLTEASYTDAAGLHYAVPSKTASSLVAGWQNRPIPAKPPTCEQETDTVVRFDSRHPDAPGISFFLRRYFDGINRKDAVYYSDGGTDLSGYQAAYGTISGSLRQEEGTFETFRSTYQGYTMADVVLERADMVDDVRETADVAFKIFEYSGPDQSLGDCVQYHYRHTLRLDSGDYKLDDRKPLKGSDEPC